MAEGNDYEDCIKIVYALSMLLGAVGLIVWICKYFLSEGMDSAMHTAIQASDADTVKNILILMLIYVMVLAIVIGVCLWCCCRSDDNDRCCDSCYTIWDYTHVVIITVAVIIQIVCGCVLVFYKCKIEDRMSEHLKENLSNNEFRPYWDSVQVMNVCCGLHGPADYKNITIHYSNIYKVTDTKLFVPETCCVLINDTDIDHPQAKDEWQCQDEAQKVQEGAIMITKFVKSEGCYDSILKDFRIYIETLYKVAFWFGGVEGFLLLITCCCIASV